MTKKEVLLLYIIFASVIVFCVFCKKESYKIEISKEITTIHNFSPIWGSKEKIKLKLLKKIEFNKKIHQRPWDFVQDNKGNKYVLIEDNIKGFDIIKFKPNWEYIRKFRKKEREPNDIINARSLAIDNESNIYVVDKGTMYYIHKFNPDGEFQKSIRMPYSSNKGCILNSGDIILIGRSFYSEKYGIVETKNPTMLIKINPNGEILKRFVECQKYSDPDLLYLANEIDFDVDGENNIYVTFQHQNRIEKYSRDGKLLFSADYNLIINEEIKNLFLKYCHNIKKIVIDDISPSVDELKKEIKNLNQLTLEITQNCNLRCKYCVYGEDYFYYRSRSNKKMEYEVTKKGIEYVFNIINERNKKEFSLSFYGGEPLLNFEIIKKIVEYSKKLFNKWKLRFSITTNGTLIDEEIINFLVLNNFQVLISLDGPKDVHDAKRIFTNGKGSFELIMDNLRKILKKSRQFYNKNVKFSVVWSPDLSIEKIYKFITKNKLVRNNKIEILIN